MLWNLATTVVMWMTPTAIDATMFMAPAVAFILMMPRGGCLLPRSWDGSYRRQTPTEEEDGTEEEDRTEEEDGTAMTGKADT